VLALFNLASHRHTNENYLMKDLSDQSIHTCHALPSAKIPVTVSTYLIPRRKSKREERGMSRSRHFILRGGGRIEKILTTVKKAWSSLLLLVPSSFYKEPSTKTLTTGLSELAGVGSGANSHDSKERAVFFTYCCCMGSNLRRMGKGRLKLSPLSTM
jgi:hypothetical protein